MMRGNISLTETNNNTKQEKIGRRDSKKRAKYKNSSPIKSEPAPKLEDLKKQKHLYRAEVRPYGHVFDQIDETTDLETALSFCKNYFGQEFQCAVVFYIDNKEIRYLHYISIMKEQFPELRRVFA